jgi:hypothetical protein
MEYAVPNIVTTCPRDQEVRVYQAVSTTLIALQENQPHIEYKIAQPDGSTAIDGSSTSFALRIKRGPRKAAVE